MDICPEYVNIEKDGEISEIDPDEACIDDIMIIKPGEKVPLDGIIIEGSSSPVSYTHLDVYKRQHSTMHLCRRKLWIDKLSAVMHIDNIKHLYFAKRYIHLYLRKTTAK